MQVSKDIYQPEETDFNLYYKIISTVSPAYESNVDNVRFFVYDKEAKHFLRSFDTLELAIDECEQLTIIKESQYFNSI